MKTEVNKNLRLKFDNDHWDRKHRLLVMKTMIQEANGDWEYLFILMEAFFGPTSYEIILEV